MKKRVFSFDVFDTAVSRPFCRPIDLFAQVHDSLIKQYGLFATVENFVEARCEAERKARKKSSGRDDVRLSDIYNCFHELSGWGLESERVYDIEIFHEINLAVPVGVVRERVASLQKSGERVVFVSDMYLPANVISELLMNCGYRIGAGDVYVSGDIGYSKYSGRLFDFVANKEKVSPENFYHIGDNYRADVLSARARGWNAEQFSGCSLSRYEAGRQERQSYEIPSFEGVSRASRVRCVSGNPDAARLVSDVVGPFLVSFVRFALLDAEKKGVATLYFVSRDGQILFKIAESLQGEGVAPGVDCRYMYGSRQAFLQASVVDRLPESIEWAFAKGTSSSPRDILNRLGLSEEEVLEVLPLLGLAQRELNSTLCDEQVDHLASVLINSSVMELILERARERRSALMRYLSDIDFLSRDGAVALVDVGWALNMQRSIARCMRAEGYVKPPSGYYLGAVSASADEELGSVTAFIGLPETKIHTVFRADWLFRLSSIIVIEHLFMMADHPGVVGFKECKEGGVKTIFRADFRDERTKGLALDLHTEAIAYASYVERMVGEKITSHEFMSWGVECAKKFLMQPCLEDVAPFAWVTTNKELSHEKKFDSALAGALTIADVVKMVAYDLSGARESFHSRSYSWIAGAVAISPASVRLLYTFLMGGKRVLTFISRAWR